MEAAADLRGQLYASKSRSLMIYPTLPGFPQGRLLIANQMLQIQRAARA